MATAVGGFACVGKNFLWGYLCGYVLCWMVRWAEQILVFLRIFLRCLLRVVIVGRPADIWQEFYDKTLGFLEGKSRDSV